MQAVGLRHALDWFCREWIAIYMGNSSMVSSSLEIIPAIIPRSAYRINRVQEKIKM